MRRRRTGRGRYLNHDGDGMGRIPILVQVPLLHCPCHKSVLLVRQNGLHRHRKQTDLRPFLPPLLSHLHSTKNRPNWSLRRSPLKQQPPPSPQTFPQLKKHTNKTKQNNKDCKTAARRKKSSSATARPRARGFLQLGQWCYFFFFSRVMMMVMMRGARGNGYRSWSKCVGMVGWLMHTHTGEQHCWRCSSKELEEFTTKFSASKIMQNNTSFLVSLLKTKDKVAKQKIAFLSFPPWAFCLFCVC